MTQIVWGGEGEGGEGGGGVANEIKADIIFFIGHDFVCFYFILIIKII